MMLADDVGSCQTQDDVEDPRKERRRRGIQRHIVCAVCVLALHSYFFPPIGAAKQKTNETV